MIRRAVLAQVLKYAGSRAPSFTIGTEADPYLRRWRLFPLRTPFNIYIHQIMRADADRELHDHPWSNVSWILAGNYAEDVFVRPPDGMRIAKDGWEYKRYSTKRLTRLAGDVIVRLGSSPHRIATVCSPCTWTLFFTGPKTRSWGFYAADKWVHYRTFLDGKETEE